MSENECLVYFAAWIVSGLIGAVIGQCRGRIRAGILFGFLLGPLGWLLIGFGPDVRPKCSDCGGVLVKGARKCMHCGLPTNYVEPFDPIKYEEIKKAWKNTRGGD